MNNPIAAAIAKLLSAPPVSNKITGKMNWEHIRAMYPLPSLHEKEGRDGLLNRTHATQKKHRHKVGASFKPRNLVGVSPAEYRRRHLDKTS